jgi:hypothetical protein
MKVAALLLIAASACVGSDISGIWRLKHAAADRYAFPIAVQVEQAGDHLQVIEIVTAGREKQIHVLWLTVAAIRANPGATELDVAGEIWTIGATGDLTIHEANGQRLVLEPAEGGVE